MNGTGGPGGSSFDSVHSRERPALTRLAYLLVRSMPVAEELAQEAFVRLHIGGEDYEVAASPDGQPTFLAHRGDDTYAMDAETGSADGWYVALARPVRDPFEVVVR